jgi:glycosyltransferase involved in cell wall biosynthesis
MIYFGRIAPEKNIELIVNAFNQIVKIYPNTTVTILGNYSSRTKKYYEEVKIIVNKLRLENKVVFEPPCNHDELKQHLRDKHIYLFPSVNPREGHSNALTEAMAWGLIPITIAQGFSKSVINNDFLIVNRIDEDLFIKKIKEIIEKNLIPDLSKSMFQRVQNNYTEHIVIKSLKNEYSELFAKYYI